MMGSDADAVRRVIDAFERSDWSEIDVRSGTLRVHLAAAGDAITPPPERNEREAATDTGATTATAAPTPPPERPERSPTAHWIVAPSPGIFWQSPEPGAPPFVAIGQSVEPDTTLCIIEVMKLMSHVKSGVSGTVTEIFVADATAVAKDDPLFAIEPGGADR